MIGTRRRVADDETEETGFTLIELIVTVVILGIIVAPLSMMLIQEFQVIPATSARTQGATDRDRLQEAMTSDITQANNVRLYPSVGSNGSQPSGSIRIVTTDPTKSPTQISYAATTQTQTTPCIDPGNGSTIVTKLFYTESWDASQHYTSGGTTIDGAVHTKHRYKLVFTSAGVDPLGHPVDSVSLRRSSGLTDHIDPSNNRKLTDDPTDYLAGFCIPGDVVATVTATPPTGTTTSNADVAVNLSLRDNSGDAPTSVTIDGTVQVRSS